MSSESTFASIMDLGNVMINSPLALASMEISKDAFSESISKFKTSPAANIDNQNHQIVVQLTLGTITPTIATIAITIINTGFNIILK